MAFEELQRSVIEGKPRLAVQLVQEELRSGRRAEEILDQGLLPAMHQIGLDFARTDQDVARILACARAMKRAMNELEPQMQERGKESQGTAIIGTAGGDLHDVGKNIVAMMFEGIGFTVIDLGVDISADRFVQALREHPEAEVVCISCLLTTSMPEVRRIVSALKRQKKKRAFYIMIGGAPITEEFAQSVGADLYTDNGAEAAERAAALVQNLRRETKEKIS